MERMRKNKNFIRHCHGSCADFSSKRNDTVRNALLKAHLHYSKIWSRPDNLYKETVNFSWGRRRLWPRENLTVGLQKVSGPDQFFDGSGYDKV